jgi:fructokinase
MEMNVLGTATNQTGQSQGPPRKIVAVGELLWDILPSGRRLGGASANLCAMVGRLGDDALLASRVGSDASGDEILKLLDAYPVNTSLVQRDGVLPTGTVTVSFTEDDQPAYRIHEGVAWDALELTPTWRKIAAEADAVCFGTLAQRSTVSRQTIQSLVSMCRPDCLRVFDMNLRHPFFSADTIQWSLNHTSLLKVNEEELEIVLKMFGLTLHPSPDPEREGVEVIMTAFPLSLVCLTLGSRGSLIVSRGGYYRHSGLATQVVDTVGAGDAYLATVVNYALRDAPLDVMSEAANRYGAWVASHPAAIPDTPLPRL